MGIIVGLIDIAYLKGKVLGMGLALIALKKSAFVFDFWEKFWLLFWLLNDD